MGLVLGLGFRFRVKIMWFDLNVIDFGTLLVVIRKINIETIICKIPKLLEYIIYRVRIYNISWSLNHQLKLLVELITWYDIKIQCNKKSWVQLCLMLAFTGIVWIRSKENWCNFTSSNRLCTSNHNPLWVPSGRLCVKFQLGRTKFQ